MGKEIILKLKITIKIDNINLTTIKILFFNGCRY